MTPLPPDHPDRFALADEVHARPSQELAVPSRATTLALLVDADERDAEAQQLARLCQRFGVPPPAAQATHLGAALGPLRLTWERHGEFSTWTVFAEGLGAGSGFDETAASLLPPGTLAALPGRTVVAVHAVLRGAAPAVDGTAPSALAAAMLQPAFADHPVVGARVADDSAEVYTDFRVHADGCSRLLVVDRSLSPRTAGQLVQRLFEIEVYRLMALLALPMARRLSPRTVTIERALAQLTDGIARGAGGGDEALLHELTRLAAEVESGLAASQFRFGACRAYADLVRTRIGELREQRLPQRQTIGEFMARRFEPAVATCATVAQRLLHLSERVAQASALLGTRVDIERERQNQALLASMDRRARLQLRLQQTVEGLSVAAIAYYAVGLVAYVAKAVKAGGAALDTDLVAGVAVPLVAAAAYAGVRRARRAAHRDERHGS